MLDHNKRKKSTGKCDRGSWCAGGIVRYLEDFPQGGCFRGKNFVFDERIAHAASDSNCEPIGQCLHCSKPCDDYSSRCRCSRCRMLVLLCAECAAFGSASRKSANASSIHHPCPRANHEPQHERADMAPAAQREGNATTSCRPVLCELCQAGNHNASLLVQQVQRQLKSPNAGDGAASELPQTESGRIAERSIRILALHGFRETASRFRGRLRALTKRMRPAATLHFVQAPHLLQDPRSLGNHGSCAAADATSVVTDGNQAKSRLAHESKCAWLVDPDGRQPSDNEPLFAQLQRQTTGWQASLAAVQRACAVHGPFDGCLAFSQGCAVATLVVALQELQQRQPSTPETRPCCSADSTGLQTMCAAADGFELESGLPLPRFEFVMLCSGHLGACKAVQQIVADAAPLQTPSLHVFGVSGQDRQVPMDASRTLASCFEQPTIQTHERGHVIPSARADVDKYLHFFRGAMLLQQ